jgi:nicotinamide-nucleotide adenylyltransferase
MHTNRIAEMNGSFLEFGNFLPTKAHALYILDSSYNPPTVAHELFTSTALRSPKYVKGDRLLLLFSTSNADKAPKPASFAHRLVMMSIFADSLFSKLQKDSSPALDIGLTTEAFFTDKAAAITESNEYPNGVRQTYLLGYDTIIRFLAPKYYPKFDPPLSALDPFFNAGHSGKPIRLGDCII